jgi:hypothetical protein
MQAASKSVHSAKLNRSAWRASTASFALLSRAASEMPSSSLKPA